ncbi:MAG TPA: hypothetical protein VK364_00055 [Hymenobacter sp.]|nr:hypothetical protein [Hymenobacter sp.]
MKLLSLSLVTSLLSFSAAVAQQKTPPATTKRPATSSTASAVERDLRLFSEWVNEKVDRITEDVVRESPRVSAEFDRQSKRIDKAVDSLTVEGKREYNTQKKRYSNWSARQDSLERAARKPETAQQSQDRLLGEKVVLSRARASELPDLYSRFIETTRAQRRQWSATDWSNASAVLGRLNARYEEVREQLPLEERVRIRSWQGEFRTLEKARDVKGLMAE